MLKYKVLANVFKLHTILDIKLDWKQLCMKDNTALQIQGFFSRPVNKKGRK